VIRQLSHLDHATDFGDGLALGNQLLGSFELADDLFGCMPAAFDGRVPGLLRPDEDSHCSGLVKKTMQSKCGDATRKYFRGSTPLAKDNINTAAASVERNFCLQGARTKIY